MLQEEEFDDRLRIQNLGNHIQFGQIRVVSIRQDSLSNKIESYRSNGVFRSLMADQKGIYNNHNHNFKRACEDSLP